MIARADRCQTTWQSHYEQCQSTITEAIDKARNKRSKQSKQFNQSSQFKPCNANPATHHKLNKVIVFGAGSLNDIPLNTLSDAFKEVLLIDLVFLPAARKKIKGFPNIQMIEHDVTESLSGIYQGQAKVAQPETWLNDPEVDLVISLNLITQLPLIPVRWLMKHQKIDGNQAQNIGQKIIQNHLNYLSQFTSVVCLIADRENQEINLKTGDIEAIDPWWNVTYPPVEKRWDWNLIPKGEKSRKFSQTNCVGVSYLNL